MVVFSCMMPGFHRGSLHVTGRQGCERWGPAVTVEDIRQRLRCSCCGHRGPRIVLEVCMPSTQSGGFGREIGGWD
jgi:hypothetical protein